MGHGLAVLQDGRHAVCQSDNNPARSAAWNDFVPLPVCWTPWRVAVWQNGAGLVVQATLDRRSLAGRCLGLMRTCAGRGGARPFWARGSCRQHGSWGCFSPFPSLFGLSPGAPWVLLPERWLPVPRALRSGTGPGGDWCWLRGLIPWCLTRGAAGGERRIGGPPFFLAPGG
ncbi:hypothetical protein NDU88_008683 [Pleurodeles waltl]|uniref:Uncharacterized protein n=1 Tax=Pleurodeles waltl TaxID=8319 RepID=A0AAV7RYR7_PLEWA|nr:hypothetical protein NDU88_008683 [Pleurodeles waltl]